MEADQRLGDWRVGPSKSSESWSNFFRWKKTTVCGRYGCPSKYRGGLPKSSILIGFSIINHPFWGTPIFGNIHMTLEPFCLMKIHSFGRVERVFLLQTRFQKKMSRFFWGANVQKTVVRAMIDQIRAGCVRCGEHATLACVLRNSYYTQFMKSSTHWHCHYQVVSRNAFGHFWTWQFIHAAPIHIRLGSDSMSFTESCRFSSFACELFNLFKKAIWEHLHRVNAVCTSTFSLCLRSMRDGRVFSEENHGRLVVWCWWFELILSTSPFLWQSFS